LKLGALASFLERIRIKKGDKYFIFACMHDTLELQDDRKGLNLRDDREGLKLRRATWSIHFLYHFWDNHLDRSYIKILLLLIYATLCTCFGELSIKVRDCKRNVFGVI
jgi:hypothetical protein